MSSYKNADAQRAALADLTAALEDARHAVETLIHALPEVPSTVEVNGNGDPRRHYDDNGPEAMDESVARKVRTGVIECLDEAKNWSGNWWYLDTKESDDVESTAGQVDS